LTNPYPYVSVIIPTYHDWDRLKLCMNGLKNQTYPNNRFEVIIINNDPEDNPVDIQLSDNYILISEPKPGSYAARNAGIVVAKGEILAFIDSDCIPKADWMVNGVFEILKGFDRVAGKVEFFFKSDKLTLAEIYEKAFAFPQEKYVNKEKSSITANLFTAPKAFDIVGLFDSSLLSGGDMEWGWRARDKGLTIKYSPETVVLHPARSSIQEIIQKNKRIVGGMLNLSKNQDNKKKKVWFIYALAPPLDRLVMVMKRKDLTMGMMVISFLLSYLINMYKIWYAILLTIGWVKTERK
jgi:glycosyltransferase involved in cell wall biosynthesis